MDWLQSILYGLFSGISEYLPISSQAHQKIFLYLFGIPHNDPVRDLIVHLTALVALYTGMRSLFDQISRDQRMARQRRKQHLPLRTVLDVQVVRNAAIPMLVGMFIVSFLIKRDMELPIVCLLLLVNGSVLFITSRSIKGNKDAGSMSVFDSWMMGICGALSCFPGISRIGMTNCVAVLRGADKDRALIWTLLLSVPALVCWIVLDIIAIFSGVGVVSFWANIGYYLLSACGAYIGASLGLYLIRLFTSRSKYCIPFAYYSWGAALFSFLIYLTVS